MKKMIFIVLLIIGITLISFGYNEANETTNKLGRAITGNYTNEVLAFYISGISCLIISLLGIFRII